jgi:hypothetical protein
MSEFDNVTTRQAQALIVGEFGRENVTATDWLAHTSERDSFEVSGDE